MSAPVPLVDLGWQHAQIAERVEQGFARVLSTGAFVDGPDVAAFEQAFASATGVPHCVALANGTDALELALRALDLPAGAGVAVPANTFIATAEAVLRAGLAPVLVDVDPVHGLLDPSALDARAASCRAAVPVHLHGQLAPMEPLLEVARAHDLVVVEDAAQAHLATQNGLAAGRWGQVAGTSFYPGKNLGAYGDGGAALTQDAEVADRLRSLRAHGTVPGGNRYHHPVLGFNSRLDTLQAVVLSAKLTHLEDWNQLRREAAERYAALLEDVDGVSPPATAPGNLHTWHIYAVQVDHRDDVLERLRANGIGAGAHYPVPLHHQGALVGLPGVAGAFPAAERFTARTLSLPIFPGITVEQQERTVHELVAAVRSTWRPARPAAPAPVPAPARPTYVHPRALCEAPVGEGTRVWAHAHVLAGAHVGRDCNIGEGAFVESGVRLGDRVTVKNGVLLWDGVVVEDDAFLGPGALFTNDDRPRSRRPAPVVPTLVGRGASVGAGAVVVCGHTLGAHCLVAAGAVVTRDVPAHALVMGVPARQTGWVCACGSTLSDELDCPSCGQGHLLDDAGLRPADGQRPVAGDVGQPSGRPIASR